MLLYFQIVITSLINKEQQGALPEMEKKLTCYSGSSLKQGYVDQVEVHLEFIWIT